MARGGTGGRISCRLKSIKRDYRNLTADGEGGRGRMMRILESLMGESGKFYDAAQILLHATITFP